MKKLFLILVVSFLVLVPFGSFAQGEVLVDKHETILGRVIEIISQENKEIPGTDTMILHQTVKVEILEGEFEGRVVQIENDYLKLQKGEKFYILRTTDWESGKDYFSVQEKYRLPNLGFIIIIFIGVVLYFGRGQGVRGLMSLILSVVLIVFVLLPGILAGYSTIFMTIAVSSIIIVAGSYITHGFNKITSAAVGGMIATLVVTGAFAYFAVHFTSLSGYESEEATYLTLNSRGNIDILGLLFGGIMIGLLGVLYDAAISQAVAVEELWKIAPHVSAKKIYERAIRIGREHIGALVDALAIAYVGASLPLLLLFYQTSAENPLVTINREIFATEIVRIMIGSIGLILAVPLTTLIAVKMLKGHVHTTTHNNLAKEEEELEKMTTHSHKH